MGVIDVPGLSKVEMKYRKFGLVIDMVFSDLLSSISRFLGFSVAMVVERETDTEEWKREAFGKGVERKFLESEKIFGERVF